MLYRVDTFHHTDSKLPLDMKLESPHVQSQERGKQGGFWTKKQTFGEAELWLLRMGPEIQVQCITTAPLTLAHGCAKCRFPSPHHGAWLLDCQAPSTLLLPTEARLYHPSPGKAFLLQDCLPQATDWKKIHTRESQPT